MEHFASLRLPLVVLSSFLPGAKVDLYELNTPELMSCLFFNLIKFQGIILSFLQVSHLLCISFLIFQAKFGILSKRLENDSGQFVSVDGGCFLVNISVLKGLIFLDMLFTLALTVHCVPA